MVTKDILDAYTVGLSADDLAECFAEPTEAELEEKERDPFVRDFRNWNRDDQVSHITKERLERRRAKLGLPKVPWQVEWLENRYNDESEDTSSDDDTVLEPGPSADDTPQHVLPSWDHPRVIADNVTENKHFIEVDGEKGSQPYRWGRTKWHPVSRNAVHKAVFAEGERLAMRAAADSRSGKVVLNNETEETTLPKMTRTKADNPANHWLDTLVGAAVAASVQGLEWRADGLPVERKGKPAPKPVSRAGERRTIKPKRVTK